MKSYVTMVGGFLILAGCTSSRANQQSTTSDAQAARADDDGQPGGGMMGDGMAGMCPMGVEGTTTRVEDVQGGAGVAFTTPGDVPELRRRVARMSEMYNAHRSDGHGPMMQMQGGMQGGHMQSGHMQSGHMQSGHMHGGMMQGAMMMPPSTARAEEIEGGARLVLTPRDPAQLSTLRENIQQMAGGMASGQCPIISRGTGAG